MKTKYTLFVLVLALTITGLIRYAQTPSPAPATTEITYAQYQADVQKMEANANYAKAESDYNDATTKFDAIVTDAEEKTRVATDEINLRLDAYTARSGVPRSVAEQALDSSLKPYYDTIAAAQASLPAASKEMQAKAVALTTIELQLLPKIDPAMNDTVIEGKAYLAHLAATYRPGKLYW